MAEQGYLSGERGVTEKIKHAMYSVAREYIYIGMLLHEVEVYEYYKENNYSDLYDYAFKELGFKRSSVRNFISVWREFSDGGMHLKDEYKDFKYSQLVEMLSLSERMRESVTSDTTVKDIRQMKKGDVPVLAVQTSGQDVLLSINIPGPLYMRVMEVLSLGGPGELTEYVLDYLSQVICDDEVVVNA